MTNLINIKELLSAFLLGLAVVAITTLAITLIVPQQWYGY
jgi:hypothetical protein